MSARDAGTGGMPMDAPPPQYEGPPTPPPSATPEGIAKTAPWYPPGGKSVAIPMMVAGVAGMAFSIIVFGGFVGLIGGALSVAGGVKARVMPALTYTFPPPYYGPPPYRP